MFRHKAGHFIKALKKGCLLFPLPSKKFSLLCTMLGDTAALGRVSRIVVGWRETI